MRWPFGPPHLTLKPSKKTRKHEKKKRKKQKKKKQRKEKKTKKTQKYQKRAFQLSINFFSFLVGVQNFPFLTTRPKERAPKNTIKIGVSAAHFLENSFASRNGHFWTRKPNPEIPVIFFVFCFSSLATTKNAKTR